MKVFSLHHVSGFTVFILAFSSFQESKMFMNFTGVDANFDC